MTNDATQTLFLGLDVGGTKTEALIVDGAGRQRGQALAPTAVDTPASLVRGLLAVIDQALAAVPAGRADLRGVGVGIPGQVVPAAGEVRLAVNLNLTAYPLRAALAAQLTCPIYLENDVRLAAYGIFHAPIEPHVSQNMVYLSLGTGVAAGLILDGRLVRGAHGLAGEIGHAVIVPGGAACPCGGAGCLEAYVAGPAIMRQAADLGLDPPPRHPGDVYSAAAAGHAGAAALVETVSRYLAQTIHWLFMTYDVEQVVLGGGVTRIGAPFLAAVRSALAALSGPTTLGAALALPARVSLAPAGFNAGAWGGVYLVERAAREAAA